MSSIGKERRVLRPKSPAELPESFRNRLEEAGMAEKAFLFLIWDSPMFSEGAKGHPASILGVTATEWIHAVEAPEGGRGAVVRHANDATLVVEFRIEGLNGHLRIDYVTNGQVFAHGITFGSAAEDHYCQAASFLGSAISQSATLHPPTSSPTFDENIPARFRVPLRRLLPTHAAVKAATSWEAVIAAPNKWFKRELAPAGTVVITDQTVAVITDTKLPPKLHRRLPERNGYIGTLLPRARLIGCQAHDGILAQIELQAGLSGARASCQICVPTESEKQIMELLRGAAGLRVL
jgi:hypothetical protein